MNRDLRRALKKARDREASEAARELIAEPAATVEVPVRRVAAYSTLLAATAPRLTADWWLAVTVAIGAISLAGLLWAGRVPETRITLNVTTEAVTLTLGKPWAGRPQLLIDSTPLHAAALDHVDVPTVARSVKGPQRDAWLGIDGGRVVLQKLDLAAGGVLMLSMSSDRVLELDAARAPVSGELSVSGPARIAVGVGSTVPVTKRVSFAIPETVSFGSSAANATPTHFAFRPRSVLAVGPLYVEQISFARQVGGDPGKVAFVSAITEGSVTLAEVAETIPLRKGDALRTSFAKEARVVELRTGAGQAISVMVEGMAREVYVGPEGYGQSRMPSRLAQLYHAGSLGLFWSSVAAVWSVLWAIRKTVLA